MFDTLLNRAGAVSIEVAPAAIWGSMLSISAHDASGRLSAFAVRIAPLKSMRDNHEKILVVRQGSYGTDIDGIRIVGARDFSSRAFLRWGR